MRWLELQREQLTEDSEPELEAQMEALVEEVMSYVRFPMMTPRQLAELLLSPLTKKYKEFFIERMAIGMSFHSGIWYFKICKHINNKLYYLFKIA